MAQVLDALNPHQRQAAEITDGPLMVLAGAGSGKTRMLTARMAHLIQDKGVSPYQILAVTFTNKAAQEMQHRVQGFLAEGAAREDFEGYLAQPLGRPEIGTFHSICVRMLRKEMDRTPFTKPFVIYDDSDQLTLVKQVMRKLDIDPKVVNPKSVQGSINRLKCDGTEPHQMEVRPHHVFDKWVQKIFEQYQKDLFSNQALDFGEILCMTYRILRDHADVRARYQHRYRYVMVDEYQDTNRIQYLWLAQLASGALGGHQNICVVGDEDQSIYKWRGADIRNILEFEKDFPGAQMVKLEQNYRSTKNIIEAASEVIGNNRERREKHLWTDHEQGDLITLYSLPDERAEAETIIGEIKRLIQDQGISLGDVAVFYRTHAQSRPFEDVLRRDKIPYQIVGGLKFYDRKEIKDVMAYFRVLLNPLDEISLLRIINVPGRGIGKTTIEKLTGLGRPLWDVIRDPHEIESMFASGTAKKIQRFVEWLMAMQGKLPDRGLSELLGTILEETGYLRELRQEATVEAEARIDNLEELSNWVVEFEEEQKKQNPQFQGDDLLSRFIEQTSLTPEAPENSEALNGGPRVQSLQMMTLHGSKGLEFPMVFIVGLEEGLFPSVRKWEEAEEEEIEEERRLFYVGMTRAEKRLYLSHVSMRRIWGDVSIQEPARFLVEIPDRYVQEIRARRPAPPVSSYAPPSARLPQGPSGSSPYGPAGSGGYGGRSPEKDSDDFSSGDEDLKPAVVGQRIKHSDYGSGEIIASEGYGFDQKVTVHFDRGGERKFLLRYLLKSNGGMA